MMQSVAILGAGASGTALAVHLSRTRDAPALRLWARDPAQASAMATARENARYLPGVTLPAEIAIGARLDEALAEAELIVVATPVAALLEVVAAARRQRSPLVWLCKGFVSGAAGTGVRLAHRAV